MSLGDIVPWKWGALRREGRPVDGLRREIESLHRDLDRVFEGFFSEGLGASPAEPWLRGEVVPRLDVTEDDQGFAVKVDLPGLDEKDVEVALADRVLTIRGEKKEDTETKEKDFYRRERVHGSFRRSIEIPAAVDTAKIEASFKQGVLTIRLPKSKEAQASVKRIDINAA